MEIYTLSGEIIKDENYKGEKTFRKMTNCIKEIKICKILMENSCKNIVKIYKIHEAENNSYIDMELLDTNLKNFYIEDIRKQMEDVKTFLQRLGIMYIDWKLDNIGVDSNGNLKLFDFDVSGKINIDTGDWEIKPPPFYSYSKAIHAGNILPEHIDNYAFTIGFEIT